MSLFRRHRTCLHRQGFSLLGLEARAALASGNWEAFERLTTVRLPLYSVAWGTLKSYEPGWRQWVSFCSLLPRQGSGEARSSLYSPTFFVKDKNKNKHASITFRLTEGPFFLLAFCSSSVFGELFSFSPFRRSLSRALSCYLPQTDRSKAYSSRHRRQYRPP